MTIGERIKERRKELGISVDELAEKLGKNRATIYRYESSDIEKLPTTVLEPLSAALHTTPAYLIGWEEPQALTSYPTNATPAAASQRRPVQFWGGVAAGVGAYAEGVAVRTMPANDEDMIDGYDYAWLEVEGDSMYPDLQDGDYVLVRVQDTAENGDLIVALIDDGCERLGVVKRLELVEGHHLTLISTNPTYPPRVFVGEQMNSVHIFGIVVSSQRKWH